MRFLFTILLLFQPIFLKAAFIHENNHYCMVQPPESSTYFDFQKLSNIKHEIRYNQSIFLKFRLCKPLDEVCNNATGFSVCIYKNGQEIGIDDNNINVNTSNLIFQYMGGNCNKATYVINIKMICDFGINNENDIRFDGLDDCTFNISWRTVIACWPKKEIDCSINDSLNYYDLNTLKSLSNNYEIHINERYSIILNICHNILYQENLCHWQSAACFVDKIDGSSDSIGLLNDDILSEANKSSNQTLDKKLQLVYKERSICQNSRNDKKMTTITLMCDFNANETKLEYIGGMETCNYKLILKSTKVCQKSKKQIYFKKVEKRYDEICKNDNKLCKKEGVILPRKINCATLKNEFNFEKLKSNKNYIIQTNDSKYYINICKPLEKNSDCLEGVGICRVPYANAEHLEAINLGFSDSEPTFISDKSAVLLYNNGSICIEDQKQRIKSRISFLCGSEKGHPEFLEYNNCTYFFKWKTNIMCTESNKTMNKNCSLVNGLGAFQSLSDHFELISSVSKVQSKNTNKTYKISLCKDKRYCNNSFVCDNSKSYGTKLNVRNDLKNTIQLNFTEGSNCNNESLSHSIYTLICDNDNISSSPIIVKENDCNVEFEWRTPNICKKNNVMASTTKHIPKTVIEIGASTLNGSTIVIIIISIIILVILIILCYLKVSSRRFKFLDIIFNKSSRHSDRVRYSRVNTSEEVNLLLNHSDPTVIASDSDDDELLDI